MKSYINTSQLAMLRERPFNVLFFYFFSVGKFLQRPERSKKKKNKFDTASLEKKNGG